MQRVRTSLPLTGPSGPAGRGVRTAAIVTWGAVFAVLGFAAAGTLATNDPVEPCPGLVARETTSMAVDIALWPPGALRCERTERDGTVVAATHMPWRDWGGALLFALGVAVACLGLLRVLALPWAAYGAAVLVLVSFAVLMIDPAAVVLLIPAALPALLRTATAVR